MEFNIILLTVTKCTPKDKKPYTRIDYINCDDKTSSPKVKGALVQFMFAPDTAFDKIPADIVGDKCTAVFELNKGLKARLVSLKAKNETISLV